MMDRYFVIVYKWIDADLFYQGWSLPKADRVVGAFTYDPTMAKGYATEKQAKIGRTKLLKFRPSLNPKKLAISVMEIKTKPEVSS